MENSKRKKVLWKAKVSELQFISSRFSLINLSNQEMRDKPKQRLEASISSRVPELIQCDRLCPSQFSRTGNTNIFTLTHRPLSITGCRNTPNTLEATREVKRFLVQVNHHSTSSDTLQIRNENMRISMEQHALISPVTSD